MALRALDHKPSARFFEELQVKSFFLVCPTFLVQRVGSANDHAVMAPLSQTCRIGWPVRQKSYGDSPAVVYEYDTSPVSRWEALIMLDLETWLGNVFAWASPAHQSLLWPGCPATSGSNNRIRMLPNPVDFKPVKVVAVEHGMYALGHTELLKIAKMERVEVAQTATTFQLVWAIIAAFLNTDSEDIIMAAMFKLSLPMIWMTILLNSRTWSSSRKSL